ncbi:hypothetical protein AB1Y20_006831 [Prymnesium parvum]|uniref:Protein RFT1 homolog n=1 Tax=Prymnesium parvum TaxID=97485 RepID=A0AB34IZ46_PRYPA
MVPLCSVLWPFAHRLSLRVLPLLAAFSPGRFLSRLYEVPLPLLRPPSSRLVWRAVASSDPRVRAAMASRAAMMCSLALTSALELLCCWPVHVHSALIHAALELRSPWWPAAMAAVASSASGTLLLGVAQCAARLVDRALIQGIGLSWLSEHTIALAAAAGVCPIRVIAQPVIIVVSLHDVRGPQFGIALLLGAWVRCSFVAYCALRAPAVLKRFGLQAELVRARCIGGTLLPL